VLGPARSRYDHFVRPRRARDDRAVAVNEHALGFISPNINAEIGLHGPRSPRAARASRMNSAARAGSTGFHVSPSTFSADPTLQPSATLRTSAMVACFTPVLASTGIFGIARFTASRSSISAASPVIGPDTRIASGMLEKTALRARSAMLRRSSE